jgi:hypothetical protein
MRATAGRYVEEKFQLTVAIEKTQQRDAKWAGDVVPALRGLRSVVSSIEKQ